MWSEISASTTRQSQIEKNSTPPPHLLATNNFPAVWNHGIGIPALSATILLPQAGQAPRIMHGPSMQAFSGRTINSKPQPFWAGFNSWADLLNQGGRKCGLAYLWGRATRKVTYFSESSNRAPWYIKPLSNWLDEFALGRWAGPPNFYVTSFGGADCRHAVQTPGVVQGLSNCSQHRRSLIGGRAAHTAIVGMYRREGIGLVSRGDQAQMVIIESRHCGSPCMYFCIATYSSPDNYFCFE